MAEYGKPLTVESSMEDFKCAYQAKSKLIERQKDDFLFRLGKQWDEQKFQELKDRGITPITDNRIQPNIFLLTGLERQNRSDFKAYPEGEEDSIKAEIASALLKHSIKVSDFGYKKSEAFEDGITCGEAYLELYLDNTYNLLNAKPCWKKLDYNRVFPEPGWKEYDFSDAKYVYKLTLDVCKEDLIGMFPEKKEQIEKADGGKIDVASMLGNTGAHLQKKDYGKDSSDIAIKKEDGFDLIERYYKKWIDQYYVGDRQTGEIKEAQAKEAADQFVSDYQTSILQEQESYEAQLLQYQAHQQQMAIDPMMVQGPMPMEGMIQPIPPTPRDPDRYTIIKRYIPEIWYFAQVPGITEPLADEKAWFYPKWKNWSIVPYLSHFSTAPLTGDDRHLLVQGIVHQIKGPQQKHNSAETLKLLHLNGAANSGWLSEEDAWVDATKVQKLGATPNVNLEYRKGSQKPERIFPMAISQGHTQIAEESAEAIKAILGINADLLAVQEGGTDSGRAIALRQRQGLLMVQKPFDNLSRTAQICGRLELSQLGEMYDTETAKKVLGDAFLMKNFPPMMMINPQTGMEEPMMDEMGQPMKFDKELADLAIAEVLSGELGQYDVSVGESVASETIRMAQFAEMKEIAALAPQAFTPDMLIENSDLPNHMKSQALKNLQTVAAMGQMPGVNPQASNPVAA